MSAGGHTRQRWGRGGGGAPPPPPPPGGGGGDGGEGGGGGGGRPPPGPVDVEGGRRRVMLRGGLRLPQTLTRPGTLGSCCAVVILFGRDPKRGTQGVAPRVRDGRAHFLRGQPGREQQRPELLAVSGAVVDAGGHTPGSLHRLRERQ